MFKKKYDVLVCGAGLYGSTFARTAAEAGQKVLLVEKNPYVSGHTFTKTIEGIPVHVYGPHYFHTNSKKIWDWVTQFGEFNTYQAKVKAMHQGNIYSLPFNMMTFYQMWGCVTPGEARQKIKEQQVKIESPRTLEEFALSEIGRDLYNVFVYGYSKKQWGREPKNLPASIIRRIPVRYTYNDNYHRARHAGVPIRGYTHLVENIIDHPNIELQLNTDFFDVPKWQRLAKKLVYSGPVDQLFDYQYGKLEYRSLEFKHVVADSEDFQGAGQVNYTEDGVPYTRISEHKHFYPEAKFEKSVISFEYPKIWEEGMERFYPVPIAKNLETCYKYSKLVANENDLIVGGRLGTYKYLDMDMVIGMALKDASQDK